MMLDMLHLITDDAKWHDRADHARQFVLSMWDPVEGKFWTGTLDDGVTANTAASNLMFRQFQ